MTLKFLTQNLHLKIHYIQIVFYLIKLDCQLNRACPKPYHATKLKVFIILIFSALCLCIQEIANHHAHRRVHTGGGQQSSCPPWSSQGGALPHPGIYGQRLKSGVMGKNKLALILKWVFSLLKSSWKFSRRCAPLFFKFYLCISLKFKISSSPYLINNYSCMHYSLFGMSSSSRNPHEGQGEIALGKD